MTDAAPLPYLSASTKRKVRWLWPGYLPFSKLALWAGNPDLGKSLLTLDIAARTSTGKAMPFETKGRKPGDVMIASTEDDIDDTILPRLEVAGADVNRIKSFEEMNGRSFVLSESGIIDLRKQCDLCHNLKLIILDPAPAFMVGDGNNNTEVRAAMRLLRGVAADYKLLVLLVSHLNKKIVEYQGSALFRIMGSLAWAAAARAAALAVEQKGTDHRLLLPIKSNLCKKPPGIVYDVIDAGGLPKIEWISLSNIDADDAVGQDQTKQPGQQERAEDLIAAALGSGWMDSRQLENLVVNGEGISASTYQRARNVMKLGSRQIRSDDGTAMRWISWLPGMDPQREFDDDVDSVDSVASRSRKARSSRLSTSPPTSGPTTPNGQDQDGLAAMAVAMRGGRVL